MLDCSVIDYQVLMLNSVAVDVQYFFATSANINELAKHKEKWLQLYHSSLTKELLKYGYSESTYPFEDFMLDFYHSSYHFFTLGIYASQVRCCQKNTVIFDANSNH